MAQTATAPQTADRTPPHAPRGGRSEIRRAERLMGFVMTLPGILLLLFFLAIPFAMAIGLSLTNQRLGSPLPLRVVGWENYAETLGDPAFWKAFFNNLWFAAIVVPLQTGLALWLAVLVNQKIKGIRAFRAIYFAPVVVVMAVAATIWLLLYSPERGLINGFLRFISFGALESNWLDSTTMALPAIILMSIWQGAGFQMVIILAGLQDIPADLYEAAAIDGATRWQQFRFVTLPQLRNTLLFVVTVTSILAFRLFDQVWVMTRGAPLGNTRTMMLQMVETGFERQQIARGSAIAVIFFLIVLTLTILQRLVIREDTGQ
jgi:multiple sugar transport system permease protein